MCKILSIETILSIYTHTHTQRHPYTWAFWPYKAKFTQLKTASTCDGNPLLPGNEWWFLDWVKQLAVDVMIVSPAGQLLMSWSSWVRQVTCQCHDHCWSGMSHVDVMIISPAGHLSVSWSSSIRQVTCWCHDHHWSGRSPVDVMIIVGDGGSSVDVMIIVGLAGHLSIPWSSSVRQVTCWCPDHHWSGGSPVDVLIIIGLAGHLLMSWSSLVWQVTCWCHDHCQSGRSPVSMSWSSSIWQVTCQCHDHHLSGRLPVDVMIIVGLTGRLLHEP